MMIYVYTLTFAIVKNGEGSTASTSRAFVSREKAEEWLIDTPARAKEALGKAGRFYIGSRKSLATSRIWRCKEGESLLYFCVKRFWTYIICLHTIYLTIPFSYAILYTTKGAKDMAKDWVERVLTGILIVSILAIHFFIGDFLFGRHEMMTYTGIASSSMKCGRN